MSPLTAVLYIALFSFAYGGFIPSGRRNTEYQLAINYHNQGTEQHSGASNIVSNQNKNTAETKPHESIAPQNTENEKSNDVNIQTRDDVTSEAAPSDSPTTESPQSSQSQVSSGSLSYAYHGQSEQSSQVSQTVSTSNVQAFSGANAELTHHHHYAELPATASVTYYHPEELHTGEVVAVSHDHFPATAYLQPERPRVLTTHSAILTPGHVTTYQTAPATITHLTSVPVQPRPVSEQAFSVNVASSKYGYGYTVRGIQHAH